MQKVRDVSNQQPLVTDQTPAKKMLVSEDVTHIEDQGPAETDTADSSEEELQPHKVPEPVVDIAFEAAVHELPETHIQETRVDDASSADPIIHEIEASMHERALAGEIHADEPDIIHAEKQQIAVTTQHDEAAIVSVNSEDALAELSDITPVLAETIDGDDGTTEIDTEDEDVVIDQSKADTTDGLLFGDLDETFSDGESEAIGTWVAEIEPERVVQDARELIVSALPLPITGELEESVEHDPVDDDVELAIALLSTHMEAPEQSEVHEHDAPILIIDQLEARTQDLMNQREFGEKPLDAEQIQTLEAMNDVVAAARDIEGVYRDVLSTVQIDADEDAEPRELVEMLSQALDEELAGPDIAHSERYAAFEDVLQEKVAELFVALDIDATDERREVFIQQVVYEARARVVAECAAARLIEETEGTHEAKRTVAKQLRRDISMTNDDMRTILSRWLGAYALA